MPDSYGEHFLTNRNERGVQMSDVRIIATVNLFAMVLGAVCLGVEYGLATGLGIGLVGFSLLPVMEA